MPGRFEVYPDAGGAFRFRLRAANGEIVAVGEAYTSRRDARRGCEAVLIAAGFSETAVRGPITASALDRQASPAPILDQEA